MSLHTSPKDGITSLLFTNCSKLPITLLTTHVDAVRTECSRLVRQPWIAGKRENAGSRFLSERQRMDRSATACKYSGDACAAIFCRAKQGLFR